MISMKTLSAVLVLSAAVASPVFAAGEEGGGPIGPGSRNGLTPQPRATVHRVAYSHRSFRGAYSRWDPELSRNLQNFGFSGRDPSRIGGEAAWLRPGG
jgi:hypothetical protein